MDLYRKSSQKGSVPVKSTQVESCYIMHRQQKNIHGKVFGGYLMRRALEIAYISCRMFCGDPDPVRRSCLME